MANEKYEVFVDQKSWDGAVYSYDELIGQFSYIPHGAEIIAWDRVELFRDGAATMRIVTEDVTRKWWNSCGGETETWEMISAGENAPAMSQRFYASEVAIMDGTINMAASRADAQYAERVGK